VPNAGAKATEDEVATIGDHTRQALWLVPFFFNQVFYVLLYLTYSMTIFLAVSGGEASRRLILNNETIVDSVSSAVNEGIFFPRL